MLLTIDVGNSDIVTILYNENKEVLNYDRRETIKENCLDAYTNYIKEIKQIFNIVDCDYIVSCVVPSVKKTLKEVLIKALNNEGYFISHKSYSGISRLLNPPEEIGADLVAVSVEAISECKEPAIIVDMGTATKIIVVDENTIIGVAIILGVKKTRDAIVNSIPHLPIVELEFPSNIVGQNTVESIQSGIMFSTVATINGYTEFIEKYFNRKVCKIITGGMSRLFIDNLIDYTYKENLVNDGLFTLYYYRKQGEFK